MMAWTLDKVARSVDGALTGAPDAVVRRVVTDSRRVRPGDLFVALRGPRFDGHAFAAEAWSAGAEAVLGEAGRLAGAPSGGGRVAVEDSRRALGRLAAAYRLEFTGPVIAVAGSNGKTTVKGLLASVLGQRLRTHASEASFNNDIGVPLTLLGLEPAHQTAVVEVGTNHPGELASLLQIVRPNHGVLTCLGNEHLEFFGDFDGVLEEEGCLADAVPENGRLFVHADGPGVAAIVRRARAPVVTAGWNRSADWRVTGAVIDRSGTRFSLRAPRVEFNREYRLGLLGVHQVANAALAVAVGAWLGLSPEETAQGLAAAEAGPMRLRAYDCGGITLLDDSYNANADSMRAALATLRDLAVGRRSIAVLGGMAELGRRSAAEHGAVGEAAAFSGLDLLVATGPMRGELAEGARRAGLTAVHEAEEVEAVQRFLEERLRPGDVVLVKASRAARLERLVTSLRRRLERTVTAGTESNGERTCCTI